MLGELARRGWPIESAFYEYEAFPRGRVVYRLRDEKFIIYADRRLQCQTFIKAVIACFQILEAACIVRCDEHYQ